MKTIKKYYSLDEIEKVFLPKQYKKKKEKYPEDPYELGIRLGEDTMRKIRKKI